jgi:hypothetical protein
MPAYNFKARFAPDVKSSIKRSTFRLPRKRPTKKGDILYLYTGLRTKNCIKLKEAVCKSIERYELRESGLFFKGGKLFPVLSNFKLTERLCNDIAVLDGFKSFYEFKQFFKNQYGLPVKLDRITW